jgi:hypothetical protein
LDGRLGGICGDGAGVGRSAGVPNGESKTDQRQETDSYLDVVERDGLLRSFRHAPLLTQIGFVVVAGFSQFGCVQSGSTVCSRSMRTGPTTVTDSGSLAVG